MASIFQINFGTLVQQLLPPLLRQPVQEAWLGSLTEPLQINNDLFNQYLSGSTIYPTFSSVSAYTAGFRVVYSDNGIYEALSATTGNLPTNTNYWYEVNPNYIGAIERSKYNSRKMIFELALNRQFQVPGFYPSVTVPLTPATFSSSANTIYITNNNVYGSQMLMDNSGIYGNAFMANNSYFSSSYMGNSFSGISQNDYTINVPNYIYTGLSQTIISNYANQLNLGGMQFNIVSY